MDKMDINKEKNRLIENIAYITQDNSDNSNDDIVIDQNINNLVTKFESVESRNIEKLEYLIKQVADFINKFENLENESVYEQFEKILYSINNSRLELLEEISKYSGMKYSSPEAEINNLNEELIEQLNKTLVSFKEELNNFNPASLISNRSTLDPADLEKIISTQEEQINRIIGILSKQVGNNSGSDLSNLINEIIAFKKNNNSNLSKVYFNLNKQIEALTNKIQNNNSPQNNDIFRQIENSSREILDLKKEIGSVFETITSQQDLLDNLLAEFTKFGKANTNNLGKVYFNLNKQIESLKNITTDSQFGGSNFEKIVAELNLIKVETAKNTQMISILLKNMEELKKSLLK